MSPTTLENRELLNFVHELKKLNASEEIVMAIIMFFEQLEHRVDAEYDGIVEALEDTLDEKLNENHMLRERIGDLNLRKEEVDKENRTLKEEVLKLSKTEPQEDILKELEELRKFKKVFRYLVSTVNKEDKK